jgi:hypothetical protein
MMQLTIRHTVALRGSIATVIALLTIGPAALSQQAQVVRSTTPPAWGEALRLVEEIRIGRLDGAEEYLFGDVEAVAVGREGTIYVADAQVPIIRAYDAQGRFVRNIGRKGGGPGEYENIGGMRTLPDRRLVLWDIRNQRITLYTSAGELIGSHRVTSGLFASDIFQVDTSGHFYVRTSVGAPRPDGRLQFGWIRVSPTGRILDTIPIPSSPDRVEAFVLSTASGYDRPFVRDLVTTISSLGYLITGRNETYAFDQHRLGAPVLRIERPYTPVSLSRAERAEWEAWAGFFQRRAANPTSSNPRAILPPTRQVSYTIPETKPAFSDLRTDSQGRIWVRRHVPAVSNPGPERPPGDERPRRVWREPPTFDVFEPAGRFLGTITLPWNAMFHDAKDRQIWATIRGESDEEYVTRFRVESAGR